MHWTLCLDLFPHVPDFDCCRIKWHFSKHILAPVHVDYLLYLFRQAGCLSVGVALTVLID